MRGLSRISKKEAAILETQIAAMGETFQARRKELGMTQDELSEKLDIGANTIKFIEQGRRIPSLPMFLRICKALKLKIELNKM